MERCSTLCSVLLIHACTLCAYDRLCLCYDERCASGSMCSKPRVELCNVTWQFLCLDGKHTLTPHLSSIECICVQFLCPVSSYRIVCPSWPCSCFFTTFQLITTLAGFLFSAKYVAYALGHHHAFQRKLCAKSKCSCERACDVLMARRESFRMKSSEIHCMI